MRAYKRDFRSMFLQVVRSTVDSDDLVKEEVRELERIIGDGRKKG